MEKTQLFLEKLSPTADDVVNVQDSGSAVVEDETIQENVAQEMFQDEKMEDESIDEEISDEGSGEEKDQEAIVHEEIVVHGSAEQKGIVTMNMDNDIEENVEEYSDVEEEEDDWSFGEEDKEYEESEEEEDEEANAFKAEIKELKENSENESDAKLEDPSVISTPGVRERKQYDRLSDWKVLALNEDGKYPCRKCQEVFPCSVTIKAHYITCLTLTMKERTLLQKELLKELKEKMKVIQIELRNVKKIQKIKKREKWLKKQEKKLRGKKKTQTEEPSNENLMNGEKKVGRGKKTKNKKATGKPRAQEVEGEKNKEDSKTTQTVSTDESFTNVDVMCTVEETLTDNVVSSLIDMYSPSDDNSNFAGEVNQPQNSFSIEGMEDVQESLVEQNPIFADKALYSPCSEQ